MARPPRPERKTELLDQILDYMLDKAFAGLSFRTLADGLGISSYVLVYHFGNREELVNEIVRHIEARHDPLIPGQPEQLSRADYEDWVRRSWNWTLIERNRQLQRLEFEAALQDPVSSTPRNSASEKYLFWTDFTATWLITQGVPPERAAPASRLFVSSLYGLQYDFVVNRDRQAVDAALELMLGVFFESVDRVIDGHPAPKR
ncbi:TetR/AcrR family transcriptional regulator [Arthrobacter sp. H5]|uniref:TetR/AcrR family transcriptional regulator n=1 Tax=Arthrobacter sp. H5 TaxID=1267973 RepID=UPI000485978D|nr:TetR/AcrR family transcriptional regulator [Arthrobacter sp. H5]